MEKEDWYPPTSHALQDVTSEQALWKPEGLAANSIWENVQHLLYYKQRLLARLDQVPFEELDNNDETFHIRDTSEEEWGQVRDALHDVHSALRVKFEQMPDEELLKSSQAVLSLITHDAYHTGQIVSLRKMQGSWPEKRSYL
nr:DinB family protein [Paenibacillus sp. JCM 10914]